MNIKISNIANLPSKFGNLKIQSFQEGIKEHLVIFKEPLGQIPLVRIHSECLTGDALGSLKCDCGEQLEFALQNISSLGGMIIYLRQEGRNIGLFNKVNAYALQDQGFDTIEANHQLGFKSDERSYEVVETILEHFKIDKIRLLTNNPKKMSCLKNIMIIERWPIIIPSNNHNVDYLKTKKEMMGHLL
ncbi:MULTISPECIES: GTP cyclohydrolase II [Sulfurospirillum]|uniref:GTP cyclohydrolase-2 n=4 Tax=Sulfurospirillum TaxID=57665 RepID=A0A1Y0HME2_9BACT|nr:MULTISPECIES: GTP cyclohydrolase II [Sulfurospirillum]AHJ12787.1 GTP cyclohydrolase II [Sulfurospirillum multivorans DSM 12446]AOO65266.1 GTP cyclohydrolase II [Sulfurospirillum halorespirans DSM 13726]ARU48746.1 GTP cyclohydrolase-2 [Sulfurospirillum diekertiae]ASC93568.1 GTP cyclohydrolase-2 [Sulfurospirillum diekertiae]ATB69609.1 GTP cyclohydrolase II [Sulfurospirillum diekertiae]